MYSRKIERMGACHTIPPLLSSDDVSPLEERCLICWESIDKNDTNYGKCTKCRVRFHPSCVTRYKQNYISDPICCPHCKRIGCLFLYDNEVYSCKKV